MRTNQEVTLREVAAKAGVSMMTVSCALHPRHGRRSHASARTCQRILRVANRLHYRLNVVARSLRLKRTSNIGFYVNGEIFFRTMPRLHSLLFPMQARFRQSGYRLSFDYFERGHAKGFREFLVPGRYVDAIVTFGRNLTDREIRMIRASGMPAVSLYEKIDGLDSLTIDEWSAGRAAADYLYQCGHREAAVIAHLPATKRWQGRVLGFLERAQELNLAVPESHRLYSDAFDLLGNERRVARELFGKFLENGVPARCLYVPSDYLAFALVELLDERGLRLGRDISLLSYDNLEGHGYRPWPTPRLTSLDPPHSAIAIQAAEILIGHSEANGKQHLVFHPQLVERDSVSRCLPK